LNVDLDVRARGRIDALVAALEPEMEVHHHASGRSSHAYLSYPNWRSGDRAIARAVRRILATLRALRGEPRRLFRRARVTLSIGVETAPGAAKAELTVPAAVVRECAGLGVGVEVVVYVPERMRAATCAIPSPPTPTRISRSGR
jgi:hypothetical protein